MDKKKVRSFVIRSGRSAKTYEELLAQDGGGILIPSGAGPLNFAEIFAGGGPVFAEIGFGGGEFLLQTALARPEDRFLGIEVYRQGVGRLMREIQTRGMLNIRILCQDAAEVFADRIPPGSLHGVHVMFPDPWPKKRHRKRRLLSAEFARVLCDSLVPGGYVWAATDWPDYAEQIAESFSGPPFAGVDRKSLPPERFERFPSKYERKAEAEGRQVREFFFFKKAQK